MLKTIKRLAIAVAAAALLTSAASAASNKPDNAPNVAFTFEGVFGTFDRAQLQRGYLVYKDVCASCHAMSLVSFRNLGEPGGPEFSTEEVKAIAAGFEVTDGPNDEGDMFQRPGLPRDRFVSPFANEQAARASNGGAHPPDLSLITKAREGWHFPWYSSPFIKLFKGNGGPEYVTAILSGYKAAPNGEERDGMHYNPYFKGKWIAMPPPLSEDGVEYADGTKATVHQQAEDVAAFLEWASEPKMEARKRRGFMVLIYMLILTVLLYLTKKMVWSKVEH